MKISARNIFQGSVTQVLQGAVNDEVTVDIGGGNKITAIVTRASVQSLGIAVGKSAVAIVKASSVLVLTDAAGIRLSARNALAGTVSAVTDGPVESVVAIDLPGGTQVHATITHDAVAQLGIVKGSAATAVIKASSVILGVKA
jgi:molybdate transport system regulatory protein